MANRARWMIYGANGYTGHLVAVEARRQGLYPVLAGRRAGPIETLAEDLGLPARGVDLWDARAGAAALADMAGWGRFRAPPSRPPARNGSTPRRGCRHDGRHPLGRSGHRLRLDRHSQHRNLCQRTAYRGHRQPRPQLGAAVARLGPRPEAAAPACRP